MGLSMQVEYDRDISDPPPSLHLSSRLLDALAMKYEVFGFVSILDLVAQELGLDVAPLHVDPDRYGNYFLSGAFRTELDSLLRIVAWAADKKIPRLRLIWF